MSGDHDDTVFWHRQCPPISAEVMAVHTVEATSGRVAGTLSHRDELWDHCYRELMNNASARILQEIDRLHGRYAHVYDESIQTKHDYAAGEAWLYGRFTYMLYRQPPETPDGRANTSARRDGLEPAVHIPDKGSGP